MVQRYNIISKKIVRGTYLHGRLTSPTFALLQAFIDTINFQ